LQKEIVVFTLQNRGSYNSTIKSLINKFVVFTLQNEGSYNFTLHFFTMEGVVFILQKRQLQPNPFGALM